MTNTQAGNGSADVLGGLVKPPGSEPPAGWTPEVPRILLSPPEAGVDDVHAVVRALASGWIAPAGGELGAFEDELAATTGAEAVLATSSGTASLHLALLVSGVQPGDDVVVQTATFAASAFAVRHAGANPVFCDVDEATGMLDPALLHDFLQERAASGRLPAAVMPVDLYGVCANYAAIAAVCEPYGIPIVQDAAESLGARSNGRAAGTHGDLAAISFNGNKIITTSGGGALLGPTERVRHAAKLASQAREPVAHYEHAEIGFNYRMSNILAALGRSQLATLADRVSKRRRVRDFYRAALPELGWMPDGVTEAPNNWLQVALLPEGVRPQAVADRLDHAGIEARRGWKPMHLQPVFGQAEAIGGTVAEGYFARSLCLPSGQMLNSSELERITVELTHAIDAERPVGSVYSINK